MDQADLRRLIGEPDFSRGLEYFRRGMVLSAEVKDPGRIVGEVRGSKSRVYHQTVRLVRDDSGFVIQVNGHCTCPLSFNCKHVAAVMLYAERELPLGPDEADDSARIEGVSGNVERWLLRLEDAYEPKAKKQPSAENLYYVFSGNDADGAVILPIKARSLKNGGFGKNPTEYLQTPNVYAPPKFLTIDDFGILQKLVATRSRHYPPRYEWPEREEMFALLSEIIDTGRARGFTLDGPRLYWGAPRTARFEWILGENGAQRLALVGDNGSSLETLPFPPPLYIDRDTGECGPLTTGLAPRIAAGMSTAPEIPPQSVQVVAERLAGGLVPPPRGIQVRELKAKPVPVLRLFGEEFDVAISSYSDSGVILPVARLEFDYDGTRVDPERKENPSRREGEELLLLRRDPDWESETRKRLAPLSGFGAEQIDEPAMEYTALDADLRAGDYVFRGSERYGYVVDLDSMAEGALAFNSRMLPVLREEGWQVETADSWPFRFYEGPMEMEATAESSGVDWFSFALNLVVDGQTLDLLPLVLTIVENLPVTHDGILDTNRDLAEHLRELVFYPRLDDGTLVELSGERLAPIVGAVLEAHGLSEFHLAEAGRAARLAEALEGCGVPWRGGEELLRLGKRLRELAQAPAVEPPASLRAELRPYQKAGFGWLEALSAIGFGGVLADDMGLGKTLQALALLAMRHLEQDCDRPSLLIVPTSLIGNWKREAARFAPDLKLLILHGPERKSRFDAIQDHHLIVTTYALARRDHAILFARQWELAILDEAQAVKNPAASTSKRIREINARQRIALTGTPMENNLTELWSLFDWLIPGLLGKRVEFGKVFRTPIEKHGDEAKRRQLSARLRPFMLRRTKEEVAADLPPKTEINEIIPLEGEQRGLYETLRVAMDKRVGEAISNRGLANSRITILDALLKLRQVCCDPSLVKLKTARRVSESAKRERLLALLEELLAEGRKVLVFSQFVTMLELIERDCVARSWNYAKLTGQTRNREAEIEKFQDGEARIFLISLKAGGTGLNLTEADTVLLYDPWWNPAVERQAMDRAHRIGQKKPVFVHKLIAEGTVEAAIQTMQGAKQALADALFDDAKGGPLSMDEEDIARLFAPIA